MRDDFIPRDEKLRFILAEDMLVAQQEGDVDILNNQSDGTEPQQSNQQAPISRDRTTMIKRENDITVTSRQSFEVDNLTFPIEGPGELIQFVVKAESTNFTFGLKIDETTHIEDNFEDLAQIARDFTFLSAFENQELNDFVVSIQDIPFEDSIEIIIEPYQAVSITFSAANLEILTGQN